VLPPPLPDEPEPPLPLEPEPPEPELEPPEPKGVAPLPDVDAVVVVVVLLAPTYLVQPIMVNIINKVKRIREIE
jgi:hypothetical protein